MDTRKRIETVRKVLRQIQLDERRAQDAGPSCSLCIFGPINDSGVGFCDHIVHWQRHHDPVRGKWLGARHVTTAEARSEEGLCGPEALLFQPYSLGRRIARRLSLTDPILLFSLFLFVCGVVITYETGL